MPMRRALLIIVIASVIVHGKPAVADNGDRPETKNLVLAGLGMAVPTYFLGVFLHEGSHALTAKAFGAKIVMFRVLPGKVDGRFYFGYVKYRGRLSLGQQTFFLLSPKLTDALMLGGYSVLVACDALPENHYGSLALTVLATGFWVDFTKDLITFWSPKSDVNRALTKNGKKSMLSRLPWRLLHIGLSATAGYVVVRGYQKVFDDSDPGGAARVVFTPLLQGRF